MINLNEVVIFLFVVSRNLLSDYESLNLEKNKTATFHIILNVAVFYLLLFL